MIYILYSDDYEVFLGGNYYPEKEVLIDTTDQLLSVLKTLQIPITLFCDLTCLFRYRESGYNYFADIVDQQLLYAVKKGHDIQAHIHPHWQDTKIIYDEKRVARYSFSLDKFLLCGRFPRGGNELIEYCTDIFRRARSYLENLLCPVNPDYKCVAFRAGGYGIQPNTREIFIALEKAGFYIDSSIVPGLKIETNVNRIDFSNVPRYPNYFISPEMGLNAVSDKGIFEIPILSLRNGDAMLLRTWVFWKMIKEYVSRTQGKYIPPPLGYSIQSTGKVKKQRTFIERVFVQVNNIRYGWWELELNNDYDFMIEATKRYINRYYNKNSDLYFSFICHSKEINQVSLASLVEYHHRLISIYGDQIKAITFQQALNIELLKKQNN